MDNEEKKKSRKECASSNAGGAFGGALLSSIASFINPLLVPPANIIGASLGSVGGLMWSQRDLDSTKKLLAQKLLSDFSKSFIMDRGVLYSEIEDFRDRMRRNSDIHLRSRDYFDNNEWEFYSNLDLREDVQILLDLGKININVPSTNAGVVATLMSLNKRYNLSLDIDHYCVNGIQQIQLVNYSSSQCYDFLISPADTFLLSPGKGTSVYRSLGPVNSHTQCTFRKNSSTDLRTGCVWAFKNSSAEMQYLLKTKIPENSGREEVPSNRNVLNVLSDMEKGDYIIVWEPLASILRINKRFEEIERCHYEVVFHLFARDCWYRADLARERIAFKRLFQNEWGRCSRDPKKSLHLLQQDNNYLTNFVKGSDFMKKNG